jgi:isoleucyl-tRNA synthetase
MIDKMLEDQMSVVRAVSEAASNARQKAGRKLRWPVSEIVISPSKEALDITGLEGVLKGQTNSKRITVLGPGERPRMNLEISPVHKRIGPAYKAEARNVIEALKSSDPEEVKRQMDETSQAILSQDGKSYSITKDMVEFNEIPPKNLSAAEFSRGLVYVDVSLTPDLQAEGYAREIIRRIQDMRKELDLRVEDKITVSIDMDDGDVLDLALRQKDYIAGEVRATEIEMGLGLDVKGRLIKDWDIEDLRVKIGINKS